MVDWNEVAIFVKVVEEGSFIGASRALGVPRSTVSRKVASLEERLGVRLLHRTTRSVNPTDEGRAYFERCAPLIREATDAGRAVSERQDVPRGRLRVTAPSLFGTRFLGPLVNTYLDRFPEVQVELLLTDRVVNLVEEGFDLAIRAGELRSSDLIARRLAAARAELVASPAYLAARGVPETVDDLAAHRCIATGTGPGPHTWGLSVGGEVMEVPVEGPLVVNALELCHRAALDGVGIARVPAFLVQRDLACGNLVRVLPEVELDAGGLYAVYPSRRHLAATVRTFVDLLSEELSGELADRVDGVGMAGVALCAGSGRGTVRPR
jgi:DNA-binding transcriptional LysR family regulator